MVEIKIEKEKKGERMNKDQKKDIWFIEIQIRTMYVRIKQTSNRVTCQILICLHAIL